MLKIAYDPIYAHPLPKGHRFPMLKYELIPEQLLHEGIISADNLFSPESLDEQTILLTHDATYWQHLRDLTLPAKEERRIGFPLSARLVEREIRIAKGTIDVAGMPISMAWLLMWPAARIMPVPIGARAFVC